MAHKYKQVREPNLDPIIYEGGKALTDWLGWCLAYVRTAFDSAWAGSTAWLGWTTKTSFRHEDRDFPVGVKFPIWFSGYWRGGVQYGHAAIAEKRADGSMTIWSTPITHKPYADTWSTIEQVESKYGVTFAGWSEDVGGTRVIDLSADPEPQPVLKDNQRVVTNTDGINGRTQPTTESPVVQTYERGDVLNFDYVVAYQDPYGNGYNYWGHGATNGNYFWLGATNDPTPGKLPVREYYKPGEQPQLPPQPQPTPVEPEKPVYPAPTTDASAVVVYNKKHSISADYVPSDLTDVGNGQQLRKEAAAALGLMSTAAAKAGAALVPQSGYRSFAKQKELYEQYVAKDGQKAADTYSARPGHSEHQTGFAIDFAPIEFAFDTTAAYAWLTENAHKYGFVLRYPSGKQEVTGYLYEPWHWRYIGVEAATDMHDKAAQGGSKTTLEEYFNVTGGLYPDQETPAPQPTPENPKPDPETPDQPTPAPIPAPAPEAAASATKFVTRIVTQLATAKIVVEGVLAALNQYVSIQVDANVNGWLTIIVAIAIIFWSQFGYKINAKFKWPF